MDTTAENMPTLKFSDFTRQHVNNFFGLKRILVKNDFIKTWVTKANTIQINDYEKITLAKYRKKLFLYHPTWNEQELQTKFISPLLELVDFDNYDLEFSAFAERKLFSIINKVQINGKVDWMVASGQHEPVRPFFFVHEYKRGLEGTDPVGQLLATLCVARNLNSTIEPPSLFNPTPKSYKSTPLYGCYIIGKDWNFVRLKGNQYSISKSYDATEEVELNYIFQMLKAQRDMIVDLVTSI